MDSNSELEEGEACYYYYKADDDNNDPDIALAYIDEKVQRVLGHFQKDFEGGVFAENLGPMFGGYGTFLPTYERSSSIWSQQETPERNITPRFPAGLNLEGGLHKPKAPSNISPIMRRTVSSSANVLHNSKAHSGDISGELDSSLPSTQVPEMCPLKDETSIRSGNPTERRTLKFRIKVGSNKTTHLNAAIYSGLGLDNSPSSSSGDSSNEGERTPPVALITKDESPADIIQVMTSFPVPEGVLVSPLHDSLLSLSGKEKLTGGSKRVQLLEKHSSNSLDESTSRQSEGRFLKKKTDSWSVNKRVMEVKPGSNIFENGKPIYTERKPELKGHVDKEVLQHKLNPRPLDNSECDVGDSSKGSCRISEVSEEISLVGVKNRLFSAELVKAESLESISGQDCSRNDKQNLWRSSGEKVLEQRTPNSADNVTVDPYDGDKRKSGRNSARLKSEEDDSVLPCTKQRIASEGQNRIKGLQRRNGVCVNAAPWENPRNSGSRLTSKFTPAPLVPMDDIDEWVMCDRCEKWRLLPIGTKAEQLPEKWLCGMLSWLPGMNRCDISEEDTTRARNALYQLPVSENADASKNRAEGPTSGMTSDICHLDKNYFKLSSQALSKRIRRERSSKELESATGSSGLYQFSKSTKKQLQKSAKSRSLNDTSNPPSNEIMNSSVQHLNELPNFVKGSNKHKQKIKPMFEGDVQRSELKGKRKADKFGFRSGASKKSKTVELYSTAKQHIPTMKTGQVGPISTNDLPNISHGKVMRKYHEIGMLGDAKCDAMDKTLFSSKKLGDKTQFLLDSRSLDSIKISKRESSLKKRKLNDCQDDQSCQNSALNGCIYSTENGFRKVKKSRLLKTEQKYFSTRTDDDNSSRKGRVVHINLLTRRDPMVDCMKGTGNFCKDQKLMKHSDEVVSQRILDGKASLKSNFGSGVSIAANSSSSKVTCSHKSKAEFEEVKGSPVESVSSSPLRTSNSDLSRRSKEKIFSDFQYDSNKVSAVKNGNRDAKHSFSSKIESAFEVKDYNSSSGDANTEKQLGRCLVDLNGMEHCFYEDRAKETYLDNAFFAQDKCSSPLSSRRDRNISPDFDIDKVRAFDPASEHSGKSMKHGPHVHEALGREVLDKLKQGKASRNEKNQVSTKNSTGECISRNTLETQRKLEDDNGSDTRSSALHCTDGKIGSQKNLNLDQEDGNKELGFSHGLSVDVPVYDGNKELGSSHGLSVDVPVYDGVSKASKQFESLGEESKVNCGYLIPERLEFGDLNALSVDGRNSSIQTPNLTLKEANDLKAYADRLKSSGFSFESNDAYFQAALKFLHGASLLDPRNSESGKHGETNQLQVYNNSAKLCEMCAHEYENRKEMAAAALAYKCMEVGYMRVVYCKYSSASRDRHELQAALQTHPQGGHVISAHSRLSFDRLLDFTEDVNSAMEASRKSQNAFAAANVNLEVGQNNDYIASVKRVLEFSFQDVEQLVRQVKRAMETMNR